MSKTTDKPQDLTKGDFSDPESQMVLKAAAFLVARAMGRSTADGYFDRVMTGRENRDRSAQVEGLWPRWMSVDVCARYISKTPKAVQQLVAKGAIPHKKVEGTIYFDRDEIDQWMVHGTRVSLKQTRLPIARGRRVPRSAWDQKRDGK